MLQFLSLLKFSCFSPFKCEKHKQIQIGGVLDTFKHISAGSHTPLNKFARGIRPLRLNFRCVCKTAEFFQKLFWFIKRSIRPLYTNFHGVSYHSKDIFPLGLKPL
jgi:hypothetical protein